MNAYLDEICPPVWPVVFATDEQGSLLGLRFRHSRRPTPLEEGLKREGFALSRDENRTAAAREQLAEYFAGERRSFDLPVVLRGSHFQEAVWEELLRIPFGETHTYGEVARAIGWPGEAVEVGSAWLVPTARLRGMPVVSASRSAFWPSRRRTRCDSSRSLHRDRPERPEMTTTTAQGRDKRHLIHH
jgi:O6-methylguanine-DNA--protein-cysteine methyltransferase